MIAGAHGNQNPNEDWTNSKGFYIFYIIFVTVFHLVLLSIPFISTALAWTLTNITHNLAHLYFLHIIKGKRIKQTQFAGINTKFFQGTPWTSIDSHEHFRETHWEQLDSGVQWSRQRKTLFLIPIILFLLTCLYTKNDEMHFIANLISLIVCIIPKLPSFHHRRLFGINKY